MDIVVKTFTKLKAAQFPELDEQFKLFDEKETQVHCGENFKIFSEKSKRVFIYQNF